MKRRMCIASLPLALTAARLGACGGQEPAKAPVGVSAPDETSVDVAGDRGSEPSAALPALPPTEPAESGFFELARPDEPAIVSLPTSGKPEPLVVAVHGAGDGPEWQCALWRRLLGDRAVIVCPSGPSLGAGSDGHYFPEHHTLERIVLDTATDARETFSSRILEGPAVYIAYSQGATMGALMLVAHGERYPRLVLVEGGYSEWNVERGLRFRESGGERVLFACGTGNCARKARRSAEWLERAGIEAKVVDAPGAGHTYGGAVAHRVQDAFDWVVAGLPGW